MTTVKQLKPSEMKDTDEDGLDISGSNPLTLLLFEFLTDPSSSAYAFLWGAMTAIAFVFRVLFIGLETCDGPNQYTGRKDLSRFNLLTEDQYWIAYIVFMLPLIIDAIARIFMIVSMKFSKDNENLW